MANLSSMRICSVTDSGSVTEESALRPFIAPPSRHSPTSSVTTVGVASPSGGGRSESGFAGRHQSCFSDGITTRKNRNAPTAARNAGAPFGKRSAAHASSVQPRIPNAALENLSSRDQAKIHAKIASNTGHARQMGLADACAAVTLETSTVNALFACCTGARNVKSSGVNAVTYSNEPAAWTSE